MMNRNIDDDLFTCFVRISMPASWNYVFARLPDKYTSSEVEHHIKDEYGVRNNQSSTAAAYSVIQNQKGRQCSDQKPRPGEPFCDNCRKPGHWIAGCWSKGGGAHRKGPNQKWHDQDRDHGRDRGNDHDRNNDRHSNTHSKGKVNQAVASNSGSDTVSEHLSYMTTLSTLSCFSWILDSGSTTHICNDWAAFTSLKPTSGTIGSINKDGPRLDVQGTGDINIICPVSSHESCTITLRNVSYCPGACDNLISESHMDQRGLTITKCKGKVMITKVSGDIVMEGNL